MMFFIVMLKGCPYSDQALAILKKIYRRYKGEHTLTTEFVSQEDKDDYKKMHHINTFPQVFYKKNKRWMRIGGYDKLLVFLKKHYQDLV